VLDHVIPSLGDRVQASGPWGPQRLVEKALGDLRATARKLAARGLPPYELSHVLLRLASLHRQMGVLLPPDIVLHIMRELPGLAGWHPLPDWQERTRRLPANIASSIETPDEAECERRRRAHVLAAWLHACAGSASAERVVCAAMKIALQEVCHGD
jgi:hypothetical protein